MDESDSHAPRAEAGLHGKGSDLDRGMIMTTEAPDTAISNIVWQLTTQGLTLKWICEHDLNDCESLLHLLT